MTQKIKYYGLKSTLTPFEYAIKVWLSVLCTAPLVYLIGNAILSESAPFVWIWAILCGLVAGSPILLIAFFLVKYIDRIRGKVWVKKALLMVFSASALTFFYDVFIDIDGPFDGSHLGLIESYLLLSFGAIIFFKLPSQCLDVSNIRNSKGEEPSNSRAE